MVELVSSLRELVLCEAKRGAEEWWSGLDIKDRQKTAKTLGLSKSIAKSEWADLEASEQDELSSYFSKHKGRIVETREAEKNDTTPDQFHTLNDAATYSQALSKGKVEVWYMKPEQARDLSFHPTDFEKTGFDPNDLEKTHVLLGRVAADDPEQIYVALQAETWSPNGEARSLIMRKGLRHTSMVVGDVISYRFASGTRSGKVLIVDRHGFFDAERGKKAMGTHEELASDLRFKVLGEAKSELGIDRKVPEAVVKKLKLYNSDMGPLPKEYIDFHSELAKESLKEIVAKYALEVRQTWMAPSGWFDGMQLLHAVVRKADGHMLELVWHDGPSGGYWMHTRGSGDVLLYVKDLTVPTSFIVIGDKGKQVFDSESALVSAMAKQGIKKTGVSRESPNVQPLLHKRPLFDKLVGPMKDGSDVRYETAKVYDQLSR